jgi:hypothetical protein
MMTVKPDVDPELVWGYWLRFDQTSIKEMFVAEDGRAWPSIRDAFWNGRLGFDGEANAQVLELVLATLVSYSRGGSGHHERGADISHGSVLLDKVVYLWLRREGLLASSGPNNSERALVSPEGRSVMLMLGATRAESVKAMHPTFASVRELVSLSLGPLSSEDRMRETELAAARWPAAFARRTVGVKFTIVLEKRDVDAPVPVTRIAWSQNFVNERVRDVFYEWLCARVDRWADWAAMSWMDGSSSLTTHLLSLVALSLSEDGPVE